MVPVRFVAARAAPRLSPTGGKQKGDHRNDGDQQQMLPVESKRYGDREWKHESWAPKRSKGAGSTGSTCLQVGGHRAALPVATPYRIHP